MSLSGIHRKSELPFRTGTIDHSHHRQSPGVVLTLREMELDHFDYSCLRHHTIGSSNRHHHWYETHRFLRAVAVLILLAVTYLPTVFDHTAISTSKEEEGEEIPNSPSCPRSSSFCRFPVQNIVITLCAWRGAEKAWAYLSARRYGKFRQRQRGPEPSPAPGPIVLTNRNLYNKTKA